MAYEIAARMGYPRSLVEGWEDLAGPIRRWRCYARYLCRGYQQRPQQARGQIEQLDNRGNLQILRAKAPLAELFGYVTSLRSLSSGRATVSLEFSHYAETPADLINEIILRIKGYLVN
jgi:elongation factor G